MGISINNIKPSMVIIYENEPYAVLDCIHVKMARGPAHCKAQLKNLKTSQVLDCTLRDSDGVREADIEERKLQFLYKDNDRYHFMDLETYEELVCRESLIKDKAVWLKENLEVTGQFYNDELVNLKIPASLIFKVIETEPGFKGDTAKPGSKPAKLETGFIISVPLFINTGDSVKVDIQSRQYLGRV